MTDAPPPLVPAEVDLRDFRFMPLDVIQLFNSDFDALANDIEWRCGVTLWCKAWHQVPAGSLPDNDVLLCKFAGLGRDIETWNKVKVMALRGFTLCSDGRLYHKVISEKALEAWDRRQDELERRRKWREKKSRQRGGDSSKGHKGDSGEGHKGDNNECPQGQPDMSPGTGQGSPEGKSLKGQGQGQGEGQGCKDIAAAYSRETAEPPPPTKKTDSPTAKYSPDVMAMVAAFTRLREKFWPNNPNFAAPTLTLCDEAQGWMDAGLSLIVLETTLGRKMEADAKRGRSAPRSFKAYELSLNDALSAASMNFGMSLEDENGTGPFRKRSQGERKAALIAAAGELVADWDGNDDPENTVDVLGEVAATDAYPNIESG